MDAEQLDSDIPPAPKRQRITSVREKVGDSFLTILNDALKRQVEEELEEMKGSEDEAATRMDETYRLFGVSSFLMKKKSLTCIRFDTCYLGHYYEIYYVFLQIPKTGGNPPAVVAHTLPACLPVKFWEEEYLTMDVQTFTQCVSLNLNSYIARREQFRAVEKRLQNLGVITSSDSYTKMDLCFDDFALKLEYGYDERYPNRVEQVVENGQEAFKGKKKKRMGLTSDNLQKFYTQPLDEV
ncbi:hypothetical protein WA577_000157, partial [Blastocystis sp. JDR]